MTIKILLIDDNPVFLAAAKTFLGTQPGILVVAVAHDGPDGLVKAALLQPDLVLLDISMPEMNGLEVAHRMRSWPVPPTIVFVSMNESMAYQSAAHDLGVVAFISKSRLAVEFPALIESLREQKILQGLDV